MTRKIIVLFSCLLLLNISVFAQKVRPPQQLRLDKVYQREVDIKWNKTLLENIEWEIQVEGQAPQRTTAITHTVAGLEPDSTYTIRVRMVSGEHYSDFADLKVQTAALNYKVDSPQRVPYLRSISLDGSAPRVLPLYFTDLADSKARITYKFNGKAVTPAGNQLFLTPEFYSDKLEIFIEESGDRSFRLLYFINLPKES